MDVTIFKKLGLNDKEIKIYLKLLQHKSVSVRVLAELTNLNRGTVYDILKKLQEIGLASYYTAETKQKFVAESADKLLKLVQEKEIEIKQTKEKIIQLIPELKSLQAKSGNQPTTKLYEDKRGVKFILEDVLVTVKKRGEVEYYVYSATQASDDINKAYSNFTRDRIKKNIQVKAISLALGGKTHGLDERRWLGSEDKSATFIIIYAGKCAFISRDVKNTPVGVIIENEMIYQTQKIIFLNLWKRLK